MRAQACNGTLMTGEEFHDDHDILEIAEDDMIGGKNE